MRIEELRNPLKSRRVTHVSKIATAVASIYLVVFTGGSVFRVAAVATIVVGAILVLSAGVSRN